MAHDKPKMDTFSKSSNYLLSCSKVQRNDVLIRVKITSRSILQNASMYEALQYKPWHGSYLHYALAIENIQNLSKGHILSGPPLVPPW